MVPAINFCESATLNLNTDGGGLTLTWKSATGDMLDVGESVVYGGVTYTLLDPYVPSRLNAVSWRYSPTFRHPVERLGRTPFWITSTDVGGNAVQLSTSSFSGRPSVIARKLADFIAEYAAIDGDFASVVGGTWGVSIGGDSDKAMISVNFDGCTVKAAATRIADAMGCNVFFDFASKTIRFIAGTTVAGEAYTHIHVLGGTRNMAKTTITGVNAAITQRLTLPDSYPGSIIAVGRQVVGGLRMTTDVILDDIYPKMELYVAAVHERVCRLTDKDGNFIAESVGAGGEVLAWKTYSKWYVRLCDASGAAYTLDRSILIANKTLGILFQPDYGNQAVDCPLAGRQFDLVHFTEATKEWDKTDVVSREEGYVAQAGEFRIVYVADGENYLPSSLQLGLCPKVGNKVTLVNVRLDGRYVELARQELATAAGEIASLMAADNASRTYTVIGSIPQVGGTHGGGTVMSVTANLHTLVCEVTTGAWSRKTLSGGIRDKIDSISGSASATYGDGAQGGSGYSVAAYEALAQTSAKPDYQEQIDTLGANVTSMGVLADQSLDILYGYGEPLPNSDRPNATANAPAAGWIAAGEEALHLEDVYYDRSREPAGTGGRMWRWMQADGSYLWTEITDMDTVAALTKVADIASDGIITGGREKSQLYGEWKQAVATFKSLDEQSRGYGFHLLDTSTDARGSAYELLRNAFWELCNLLECEEVDYFGSGPLIEAFLAGTKYPAMLCAAGDATTLDLGRSTRLSDVGWSAENYRQTWEEWYDAVASLESVLGSEVKSGHDVLAQKLVGKVTMFVGVSLPSAPYAVGDLWWRQDSDGSTTGRMYYCTHACAEGGTASLADWSLLSDDERPRRVRELLADVAEEWGSALEYFFGTEVNYDYIQVYIQSGQPEDWGQANMVWFDGVRVEAGWSGSTFTSAVAALALKNMVGSISFRVWRVKPSDAAGRLYDLWFVRETFRDRFTNRDITGGYSVWVHGTELWEQVRDGTSGLIQNYGDHIVQAIFGHSADGQTNYAAGLTLEKQVAELFAEGASAQTGATALAAIKAIVEVDATTGLPTGHVVVSADKVDFEAAVVNVHGTLTSADGRVKIERVLTYDNPPMSNGTTLNSVHSSTGLSIYGADGGRIADIRSEGLDYDFYTNEDEGNVAEESGVIVLRRKYTRTSGTHGSIPVTSYGQDVARLSPRLLTASRFGISAVTVDSEGAATGESVAEGLDTTFDTADGMTVTVRGGLIVGIQPTQA